MIAELNSGLGRPDERDRLFALSELCFATRESRAIDPITWPPRLTLMPFCFRRIPADEPGEYDPRLHLAVDLYDRAIALGLATKDGKQVDLSAQQFSLPFGSLTLASPPNGFTYAGYHLTNFVSLSDMKVRGLRNTYRVAGIGAALSAGVERSPGNPASRWIPPSSKVPMTAFIRFDDPRLAMSNGHLHGTVELYDEDRTETIEVGKYTVPLASDPSAALAYRLRVRRFGISSSRDFDAATFRWWPTAMPATSTGSSCCILIIPNMIPGRVCSWDRVESCPLGRDGQRAARRSGDRLALSALVLHLQQRQSDRLVGDAAARIAAGGKQGRRSRQQGSRAQPDGRDWPQPGRAADQNDGGR